MERPSKGAAIPPLPSIPGANIILIPSKIPASRKPALILPPPTIAIRFTPNSPARISTDLARSILVLPQAIQEIFLESRYSRYSFETCSLVTMMSGASPSAPPAQSRRPFVSTITLYPAASVFFKIPLSQRGYDPSVQIRPARPSQAAPSPVRSGS